MALLELDLEQAQALLIQAKSIAETKGLQRIANMISGEHFSLMEEIKTWQKLAKQKPPMNEIVELTQLEELLDGMIYNKLQREEQEILDYAARAQVLVKMLEKE